MKDGIGAIFDLFEELAAVRACRVQPKAPRKVFSFTTSGLISKFSEECDYREEQTICLASYNKNNIK